MFLGGRHVFSLVVGGFSWLLVVLEGFGCLYVL